MIYRCTEASANVFFSQNREFNIDRENPFYEGRPCESFLYSGLCDRSPAELASSAHRPKYLLDSQFRQSKLIGGGIPGVK